MFGRLHLMKWILSVPLFFSSFLTNGFSRLGKLMQRKESKDLESPTVIEEPSHVVLPRGSVKNGHIQTIMDTHRQAKNAFFAYYQKNRLSLQQNGCRLGPGFETLSSSTPIVTCGVRWIYKCPVNEMLPNENGLKILRDGFELVKPKADQIAFTAIKNLVDRLPSAAQTLEFSGRIKHLDNEWELEHFGKIVLAAIECCLLRANDAGQLRSYLSQLTKVHNKVGVKSIEIPFALHSFEVEILRHLRPFYDHGQNEDNGNDDNNNNKDKDKQSSSGDGNLDDGYRNASKLLKLPKLNSADEFCSCVNCNTWRNFFDLINLLMVYDMNE